MTRTAFLRAAILCCVTTAAAIAAAPPAHAQELSVDVSIGVFHDQLAPYGRWVRHDRFGSVWVPHATSPGWRPYTNGHWVYTDAAWMWVSDEPFGWATYHYGRWFLDPVDGWVWVPDSVWAPAWVAWRTNDEYVGWAPLPPEYDIDTDMIVEPVVEPLAFTFVRTRYLVEPALPRFIEPPARNVFFVRTTFGATRYSIEGTRVINRGVAIERVQRVAARPIPRLVIEASRVSGPTRVMRDRVIVAQPIAPAPERFAHVEGRAVIAAPAGRLHAAPAAREARPLPMDRPMPRQAGPAPATPPPPSTASPRNDARTARPMAPAPRVDRQALDRRQAQERTEMERRHARERQHPPANISPRALNERQAAEMKELLTRQDRERRALDTPQPQGR